MRTSLNKLEELQKKENKLEFIKSYPILKKVLKSQLEKDIIELVLSFQHNGKAFHMNYDNIANILVCKVQSVRNTINKFKKNGYLITDNTSNFNGVAGGSSTSLVVDIDLIISHITTETPKVTPKVVTVVEKQIIPEVKEDILEDIKVTPSEPVEDNIKAILLAKVRESVLSNKITDTQGESLMVEIDYDYIKTPTALERELIMYLKDNDNKTVNIK